MKSRFYSILLSFAAGLGGAYTFQAMQAAPETAAITNAYSGQQAVARYRTNYSASENTDFTEAARQSTPSVVFIKTLRQDAYQPNSYFDLLFGRRSGPVATSGSGVIYSGDGYIITNNHVIDGARQIEVVHQRRTYPAKLIGADPSTDLAVLKVETNGLPAIQLGNSSGVEVGEWVLAVGNPFNLTSTVTAGIVSAKGREINILKSDFPIESFIQTDAAINPGNSGGALVNMRGELVGINTAILSQTGSYAGYGFAVPVDIVRKIADDLIRYGEVQKAFFGAEVVELDINKARELNVKADRGVVLAQVLPGGAADKAGLQAGDIIVSVENQPIRTHSSFEELLSYRSPGDKIQVAYIRQNQTKLAALTLTNREGGTEVLRREIVRSEALGAELEKVSKVERDKMGIEQGVRIRNVQNGLIRRLRIGEGFVVTHINDKAIETPKQLEETLLKQRGRVIIEGVSTDGRKGYYQFYF